MTFCDPIIYELTLESRKYFLVQRLLIIQLNSKADVNNTYKLFLRILIQLKERLISEFYLEEIKQFLISNQYKCSLLGIINT